ncbi:MAG: large repetitive protein [Gaiellaceae bacterium]|nr:large repetitive protein [Gaiellaceae bacterium]
MKVGRIGGAAALICVLAGLAANVAGAAPRANILGVVPPRGAPAATLGTTASHQLVYHGGSVLRTTRTYAIYWTPSGYSFPSIYRTVLDGYFQNVARASGDWMNVYDVNSEYYDTTGPISSVSTFGGSTVDTAPLPARDAACTASTPACITDAQLRAEIVKVAAARGWARTSTSLFFMFTPSGVGSCFSAVGGCSYSYYCAYHGYANDASGSLLYANQPWVDVYGCRTGAAPNGDVAADAAINVVSHEHNESITDPYGTGWYDANGQENGDLCAWQMGAQLGWTATGAYNQVIGKGKYWLQQEWSNAGGGCVQRIAAPTPTLGPLAPAPVAVGATVTVNGTSLTGATSVKVHGVAAQFTVDTPARLYLKVPAGSTTGAVTVTTPGGTVSSATVLNVIPVPTISAVGPASAKVGKWAGAAGTNFSGVTSVKVSGLAAQFILASPSLVYFKVPAGATTGKVTVTTPGGTATSTGNLTVTP